MVNHKMLHVYRTEESICKKNFADHPLQKGEYDNCSGFGLSVSFENCVLDHSSFFKVNLKKTAFRHVQLHEVDFSECDLTEAVFDDCDLKGTIFDHTILQKADLRTAKGYSIDPESNRIKKARFGLSGVAGLLNKYDIEIDRTI